MIYDSVEPIFLEEWFLSHIKIGFLDSGSDVGFNTNHLNDGATYATI